MLTRLQAPPFDALTPHLAKGGAVDAKTAAAVGAIVDDVRARGDDAVRDHTRRLDGRDLAPGEWQVSGARCREALSPVRLAWLNSPSNPTGRVLPPEHLAKTVSWARERGTVLASDECYIEQGWDASPVSVLHPDVSGGTHEGLLAVHSMSKRANMAGYRAGFVTGDPGLIAELHEIRRHAGMIMPAPVQAAMAAALDDDAHADEQRERYRSRRTVLWAALEAAGWVIENSEAGLYLWAARAGSDGWDSARILAEAGILVSPGELYGAAGVRHIRVALTATDERVAAAAARLSILV